MSHKKNLRPYRRSLLNPMPFSGDAFPKPGEVRAAIDMDLQLKRARLVAVLSAEATPTPWAQVVLIDTDWLWATSDDFYVTGSMSDIPFPFLVETDVTGPVLISQLGPCIGELRKDVLDVLVSAVQFDLKPAAAWPNFGTPWVPDDPRADWKRQEIELIGDLSSDAFRAVVEDEVFLFPSRDAWASLEAEIRGGGQSERLKTLLALFRLKNFAIPVWLTQSLASLYRDLSGPDERALLQPLMEQALIGPIATADQVKAWEADSRRSEKNRGGVDASLDDISGRHPNCRAFVRLNVDDKYSGHHEAMTVAKFGDAKRVQVSDRMLIQVLKEAA